MKRYTLIFLFVLSLVIPITAQSNDSINNLLHRANQLYKQEDYAGAAQIYENLYRFGTASELHYNLGNSYYKSDELGKAILNYERALRLKPNFQNARYNLKIAEEKLIDNVSTTPSFWARRIVNIIVQSQSSNSWAYISFALLVLFLTGFLLFGFSRKRVIRKVAFNAAITAFILFAIAFTASAVRKKQFINHDDAIVMRAAVMVKSAPDQSGTDLFELHEGTKVQVKSTLEGWAEIKLDNGAIGWLEGYTIERI